MTESQIKADKALCEAATPGPWVIPCSNLHRVIAIGEDARPARVIVEGPADHSWYGMDDLGYLTLGCERGGRQCHADRQFIARAREALPQYIAEVERLRETLARWVPHPTEMSGCGPDSDPPEDVARMIAEACDVHGVSVPDHITESLRSPALQGGEE